MEVIYLRRAIADERREAAFWEERSPMLKDEFLVEIERSIGTIRRTPEGYAIVEKPHGLRRFVEKRFRRESTIATLRSPTFWCSLESKTAG
jgi:hypothetical protein